MESNTERPRARAVLDTNVIISGIHWKNASQEVLERWSKKEFEVILTEPILGEYLRVLALFKKGLEPEELATILTRFVRDSIFVFPLETLYVIKDDPHDNKFLEAAIEGKADYIISRDQHLLKIRTYEQTLIVTPEEFSAILQ